MPVCVRARTRVRAHSREHTAHARKRAGQIQVNSKTAAPPVRAETRLLDGLVVPKAGVQGFGFGF